MTSDDDGSAAGDSSPETCLENASASDHAELLTDIDVYAPPGIENGVHTAWKAFQESGVPPVAWTERNGGHWVVSRAEAIKSVYTDPERFSSAVMHVPRSRMNSNRPIPGSIDPPDHAEFRSALNAHLGPKVVAELRPGIEALATSLVDEIRPRGECHFLHDFGLELPLKTFFVYADLPLEDLPNLRDLAEQKVRPTTMTSAEVMVQLSAYLTPIVQERLANPTGEDLFSRVLAGAVHGRQMTLDEGIRFCAQLLVAGLDTVANLLTFGFHFLATQPELQATIVSRPEIIPKVARELIRRFPLVVQAREARSDIELAGAHIHVGDIVIAPTVLYALDDDVNEDPMAFDFERKAPPHFTFGQGNHRCPGAFLATAEVEVVLAAWFAAIPSFRLKHADAVRYRGGNVSAIDNVELEWTV